MLRKVPLLSLCICYCGITLLCMVAAREKKRRNPRGKTVILIMLLLHGATTYAGQGWYHLVPPWGERASLLNTAAPLREWHQMGAYDTAKDCEANRAKFFQSLPKNSGEKLRDQIVASI